MSCCCSYFLIALLSLLAQTPYYGPKEPPHFDNSSPTISQLVQVQIQIYDQPDLGGLKIKSASFNGVNISLQSADIHGFRGGGSFQVPVGNYKLNWQAGRDEFAWPRTIRLQDTVPVGKRDDWVQVTIRGDQMTVL